MVEREALGNINATRGITGFNRLEKPVKSPAPITESVPMVVVYPFVPIVRNEVGNRGDGVRGHIGDDRAIGLFFAVFFLFFRESN
jgi:hypothetical protein